MFKLFCSFLVVGFFFLQNTQKRLFPDKMSFKTQIVDHNNEIMSSVKNIRL